MSSPAILVGACVYLTRVIFVDISSQGNVTVTIKLAPFKFSCLLTYLHLSSYLLCHLVPISKSWSQFLAIRTPLTGEGSGGQECLWVPALAGERGSDLTDTCALLYRVMQNKVETFRFLYVTHTHTHILKANVAY